MKEKDLFVKASELSNPPDDSAQNVSNKILSCAEFSYCGKLATKIVRIQHEQLQEH